MFLLDSFRLGSRLYVRAYVSFLSFKVRISLASNWKLKDRKLSVNRANIRDNTRLNLHLVQVRFWLGWHS